MRFLTRKDLKEDNLVCVPRGWDFAMGYLQSKLSCDLYVDTCSCAARVFRRYSAAPTPPHPEDTAVSPGCNRCPEDKAPPGYRGILRMRCPEDAGACPGIGCPQDTAPHPGGFPPQVPPPSQDANSRFQTIYTPRKKVKTLLSLLRTVIYP